MQRDTNSLAILAQFADEVQMPTSALFKGTAINQLDEVGRIEDVTELKVLSNLLNWWLLNCSRQGSQWPDSLRSAVALGWQLGKRYQLTSYGIWGYALLASGSQREAIILGLRYLGLTYTFCDFDFNESKDRPFLSLRPVEGLSKEMSALVLMRDLTALTMINRELFQEPVPEIQVSMPSWLCPVGERDLGVAGFLGADVREFFEARANGAFMLAGAEQSDARVYFDPNWLDRPLPRANQQTAAICENQCRQLLEEKKNLSGVCGEVRAQIMMQGPSVSMATVAKALGMTERTLHRRLLAEQSSWRQVRDAVRYGMAEALLETQMSIDAIALELGFSDGANFIHGFKRWSGVTPGKYRMQIRSK